MTQSILLSAVTADVFISLIHLGCKRRNRCLRDWLQSSTSSESSESLQGLSSSACCNASTTSAASRFMSKRKSADANDLEVDDPKHVWLRAYSACLGPRKDASMLLGIKVWRNFESKAGGDFRGMRCESTFYN